MAVEPASGYYVAMDVPPPTPPQDERARRLRQQAELSGSLAPEGMGPVLDPGGAGWTAGYGVAWRQIRALPVGLRLLASICAVLVLLGAPVGMLMLLLGDGWTRTAGLILLALPILASFGATILLAVRSSRGPRS